MTKKHMIPSLDPFCTEFLVQVLGMYWNYQTKYQNQNLGTITQVPSRSIGKSRVALHMFREDCTSHIIEFHDTVVLSTTSSYYPRLHRQALMICKYPNNRNKGDESQWHNEEGVRHLDRHVTKNRYQLSLKSCSTNQSDEVVRNWVSAHL